MSLLFYWEEKQIFEKYFNLYCTLIYVSHFYNVSYS